MENKFDAKGQLVYVEPDWVTGETCLFNIRNAITYATSKNKLTKLRKDFINRLEQEGFIITYDKINTDKDIVYLIMDDTAITSYDTDINIYKKEFDKRMFKAGGEKLNYPYSLNIDEYLKNPFYPAVFKNEATNGGIDKFLIEKPEQLELIKKCYENSSNKKAILEAFQMSIFQQFIETPTDNDTYLRVLMSASGELMGASLKYSKKNEKRREPEGILEKIFWDEQSEYFLNCNGIFNYYSEGGNISFSQPKYSSINKNILEAHGLDSNNPQIPEEVLEVAASIMKKCNRELGIICGFDFILNVHDNKWYYLENQAFPAIEEWAITKGIRKIRNTTVDDYIKYCALELEARYDALMMYMRKKQSYIEEPKKYTLKNKKMN